jgi:hypothetical protein
MAITNAFGSRDDGLWELAKVTEGWGRIALVRQLASTQRPEIKAWILRETGRDYLLLRESGSPLAQAKAALTNGGISDEAVCSAESAVPGSRMRSTRPGANLMRSSLPLGSSGSTSPPGESPGPSAGRCATTCS